MPLGYCDRPRAHPEQGPTRRQSQRPHLALRRRSRLGCQVRSWLIFDVRRCITCGAVATISDSYILDGRRLDYAREARG